MARTDTRLGTVEDVLAGRPEHVRETFRALRAVILDADPDAVETPSPTENAVSYGIGPRKMKEGYAYLMPLAARVNLGFYRGVALPDPHGLLEGTGKALRHVKVTTKANATRREVAELVREAIAERRAANGLPPAGAATVALPAPGGS